MKLKPLLIVLSAALSLLAACSPPMVNIPPLTGDVAWHNPNKKNVVSVQAVALRHVVRRYPPPGGAYAIELVPGSNAESYALAATRLPEGLTSAEQFGEDVPRYQVAQVYIYGTTARVDVIKPSPTRGQELVSVFEAIDIDGWYADRSRLWNISVDVALKILRSSSNPPIDEQGGTEEKVAPQ